MESVHMAYEPPHISWFTVGGRERDTENNVNRIKAVTINMLLVRVPNITEYQWLIFVCLMLYLN